MKFSIKFRLFNKVYYLVLKVGAADFSDSVFAIDSHQINYSGKKFKGAHYLLADYDTTYPKEASNFILKNGIRRGLIVESSKGKYHFISFTPIEFNQLCTMMATLNDMDKRHFHHLLKDGFNSLRFTKRRGEDGFKIVKVIDNFNSYRFYDFEAEETYRKLLGAEGFIYGNIQQP